MTDREQAIQLAKTSTSEALSCARQINDPWYACQALAWVARYAPDDQVRQIANEALDAAAKTTDLYKLVGASAWPLRALIERGATDQIPEHRDRLLGLASQIDPLNSRAEAAFHIFVALRPGNANLWLPAFELLASEASGTEFWRQRRNLRDATLMVAREFPKLSDQVVEKLPDGKLKRSLVRSIEAQEYQTPREFFR